MLPPVSTTATVNAAITVTSANILSFGPVTQNEAKTVAATDPSAGQLVFTGTPSSPASVTLIALLVVFFAVGWDLLLRQVGKAPEVNLNNIDADLKALLHGSSHSFSVPELGLTMADGGERIDRR